MIIRRTIIAALAITIASLAASASLAQDKAGSSAQNLQEAAQNPIASLISVPFQNNFNFGVGERDKMQYVLNVQPVYPAALNSDWNLIIRPIVPIIDQPKLFNAPASDHAFGLGDINLQTFFSPAKTVDTAFGHVSWGVGPSLVFPTATDDQLGSDKWSAGPGAVVFVSKAPFTYGALMNNVWSYAGDSNDEDVNQLLMQPFLNYNLPDGWSIGTSPIITANWEASDGDRWTVPVGGGIGKLFRLGKLPIQANLKAYYNVETPEFGPDWQLQFQFAFLFPR